MLQALYEKKVGQKLLLVCFLVLFLLALLFGSLNAANRSGSWDNAVTLLNDGWTLTAGDGTAHAVSLPTYCAGGDHSVKLDCLMPSGDRLTDPVIRIFSDYERLQVTLDGQTIYEYTGTNATEWSMTGATGRTVHMIPLPSDYAGKPLSICYEFELTNGGRFGLSAPQLASKAALFSRDMIDELPYVMMAAIAAIAGIAMIVVRLTMKEQEAFCNTVWYVGLFSVMFAAFTLYQTVYADALLPNGTVLHMMVYSTALLMPIPVAGLFTDYFGTRARRLCIAAIALCFVSFFVQMGLYVAGAVDFRTLLPVTFAVIVLAGAAIIAAMLLDRRDGQSDVGRMFYTSVPPVVGAVADLALMLWGVPMSRHMLFFTIGVAVFILLQSIWFVRSYLRMVRAAAESKVLREMAFKDTLTGVGNRNAYERYIQALSTRDSREQLYCAVA
ncbi:MAG: hypothetical protein IKI63_04060, partial [Clostridia bacterium]|nr:hypothetical protein [Clostridia bacterium]